MGCSYTGRAIVIAAALWAALPLSVAAQTLSTGDIVSRMEQVQAKQQDNYAPYTLTREYRLATPDAQKSDSRVVAEINSFAPSTMDYTLRKTAGSDRGEKIVRKVLDHESQMLGHPELVSVSQRNYTFTLLGRETIDGHDCYVLQLQPKRSAPELLLGKAWVGADDFILRRLDGEPAKSPSWWIKDLRVTINYGEIHGVWTQLATRAVADVRFAGPHLLTSRALDLTPATEVARVQPAHPTAIPRSMPRRGAAQSAVWVRR